MLNVEFKFTKHMFIFQLITEQIRVVKERVDKADVTLRALNSEMHRLFLQLHEVTSRIAQLKDK